MEQIKTWLLAVTAVTLLRAIARQLMPPSPVRGVGELVCALLLVLTLTRPLLGIGYDRLTRQVEEWARESIRTQTELTKQADTLRRAVIQRRSSAYSEDMTAGLDCTLTLLWDFEDDPPSLTGAEITGTLTPAQRQSLQERISNEFGIPDSQITFTLEAAP